MSRLFRIVLVVLLASWSAVAAQKVPGQSAEQFNYTACLEGLSFACERGRLTPVQLAEVEKADYRRNYQACVLGLSLACDRSRLTPSAWVEVERTDRVRNYQSCLHGLAYPCDRTRLTPDELRAVQDADRARNYRACLFGLASLCDPTQLSPAQLKEVGRVAEASRKLPSPQGDTLQAPAIAPRCAENGSCYGDISAETGRPKTVHVRGYYRKDGTYVRGHYRSKPRR